MIILFGPQDIANTTFIRLQLRHTSCDRVQSGLVLIFGNHVNSQHIILNIKFGVNRMFHVVKTPVYRFDLYGRHRILWTDIRHFRMGNISLCANFLKLFVFGHNRVNHRRTDGRTDGQIQLKCLRILRCSNVSKEHRVPDHYIQVLHTY